MRIVGAHSSNENSNSANKTAMKKGLISLSLITLAIAGISAKKSPVLLNVAGKDVTLDEFEYLYHKNNAQQQSPQSIDEYLKMFIDYKLKVADAEAAGLDNRQEFVSEFDGYRRDLARPYLTDTVVENAIYHKEYDRLHDNIDVSHIMLPLGENAEQSQEYAQRLDSIRTAILAGSDFETLAREFSIDRAVTSNGGRMGWITACRLPYTFEDASWETPVGEISPVIKTPFGHHIVKVNDRRKDPGQVHARHIIKVTRGMSPEQKAVAKAQIDSIYQTLISGGDFASTAARESQDDSASHGGDLGFFGPGQMVPDFEQVAFALNDGQISEPFETQFGYHIVQRIEHKDLDDYETALPMIKNAVSRDERSLLPVKSRTEQLIKKYNAHVAADTDKAIRSAITANNGIDSTMIASLHADKRPLIVVGKKSVPVSEVFEKIEAMPDASAKHALDAYQSALDSKLSNVVQETERERLSVENNDYRNLLNEYRDGILLFEISDRNVWSKAKDDKEGLENYFRAHRDRYHWDAPKFKSYVIFSDNDSIANAAQEYLNNNTVEDSQLIETLRKLYGRTVKVERVIAAKGDNAITDYLAFGGEKPAATGRWAYYFAYKGRVIDQPEEAADERGAVTGDYQASLEKEWLENLHAKYPVKVNEKVLKQAK